VCVLEPTFAQAVKKIIAAARAISGRVQHVSLCMVGVLQIGQTLCRAPGAFALAPQIEKEEGGCQDHEACRCQAAQP